jgi:hypothetical protein
MVSAKCISIVSRAETAWRVLLRPDEVEALVGVDPGIAGHAAYGVQASGVDAEVLFKIGGDVDADDLAEDDDAGAGALAGEDDLQQLAFEVRRRFGDARGPDEVTGDRGEARDLKFVDFGKDVRSRLIAGFSDRAGDDVDDEFAGLLDVAQGIFAVVGPISAVGTERRAEEHGRRVGSDPGEEAEGGNVGDAILVDGGDECDGTGYDEAGHQLVDVEHAVVGGIEAFHGADNGLLRGGHASSINGMANAMGGAKGRPHGGQDAVPVTHKWDCQ